MRPLGDITMALLDAAAMGPGTVRDLAERAQVGYSCARYTATRMVAREQLVCVKDERPALLALPSAGEVVDQVGVAGEVGAFEMLDRAFWSSPPQGSPAADVSAADFAGL